MARITGAAPCDGPVAGPAWRDRWYPGRPRRAKWKNNETRDTVVEMVPRARRRRPRPRPRRAGTFATDVVFGGKRHPAERGSGSYGRHREEWLMGGQVGAAARSSSLLICR